ncbi:Fatty acyl-coenzyme A reductase, NAD-binding domain [Dillenia turbinata]|uniref:Fatty acyl-CoA reductase n=1 Tax=Dillenia turbinata TaxID=194707 RepID=A0AAN8ZL90_9MAGN
MGALILNTLSFSSESIITSSNKWNHFSVKRKSISVYCQSGGKAIKSDGFSSVLTDLSTLVSTNHSASVTDAGSLVLSPTGVSQGEVALKGLVPYGGGSTPSLVDIQDGIGIVKFIKGKKFLITGATGFLGKVLIEKILRTVPDVGKIFLLINAKNKEAAMERLKGEIINSALFKCLQQTHGRSYQAFMLSKLVPLVGNVCESNLGLDKDLANVLRKEVEVIINSAANTTFDERQEYFHFLHRVLYDVALNINTRGPFHIMSFARECKKLELVLQVSTAYVNGQRQGRIMEKPFRIGDSIVGEKLDIEAEIKLALDSQVAFEDNVMAQKMKELGLERANTYGWQDTYVFTKAMGEMLIDNMRGEIPVVIIRPSVIESTLKEPFPGWMEGNRHVNSTVLR